VKYAGNPEREGFDAAGKLIAKLGGNHRRRPRWLIPDRKTINADGEDGGVFRDRARRQGRGPRRAEQAQLHSKARQNHRRATAIPSYHEPTCLFQSARAQSRLERVAVEHRDDLGKPVSECSNGFDDSLEDSQGRFGEPLTLDGANMTVFTTRVTLTEETERSAADPLRRLRRRGWYFVNGQWWQKPDWSLRPTFDVKKHLRPGENVIAVCVSNGAAGGMYPQASMDIVEISQAPWSAALQRPGAVLWKLPAKPAISLTASANGSRQPRRL
jgi:hypothetical protein